MMRNPNSPRVIRLSNGIFVAQFLHFAYADTNRAKAWNRLRREFLQYMKEECQEEWER